MIDRAIEILRAGGLVAFPTETVYGLGADATRADAVRKVFALKGRPSTNPLIVHVANAEVARRFATAWPETADRLTQAFWPGPLTIILPKHPSIVDEATAGRATVGLRVPDHPLTLELLRALGGPLVGPSANRSTHVSPTTAEHVRHDLGDRVDLILDGGPCRVGIESTVVDLTGAKPAILRPGGVSQREIAQCIGGPVDLSAGTLCPSQPAASPGQHAIHYAPRSPAYRYDPADAERLDAFLQQRDPRKLTFVSISRVSCAPVERWIAMPPVPEAYAQRLYGALRQADQQAQGDAILIEMPPDEPGWAAVRDRLSRASRPLM